MAGPGCMRIGRFESIYGSSEHPSGASGRLALQAPPGRWASPAGAGKQSELMLVVSDFSPGVNRYRSVRRPQVGGAPHPEALPGPAAWPSSRLPSSCCWRTDQQASKCRKTANAGLRSCAPQALAHMPSSTVGLRAAAGRR